MRNRPSSSQKRKQGSTNRKPQSHQRALQLAENGVLSHLNGQTVLTDPSMIGTAFGTPIGFPHIGQAGQSTGYYYPHPHHLEMTPQFHISSNPSEIFQTASLFPLKPRSHNVKDSMAKRNERERNRVKMVNLAFDKLRQRIPWAEANPKMSKVDTLRAALEYIKSMQDLISECDAQKSANLPGSEQNLGKSIGQQTLHGYQQFDQNSFIKTEKFQLSNYENQLAGFEQSHITQDQSLISTSDYLLHNCNELQDAEIDDDDDDFEDQENSSSDD